jgi:DNA-binding transcriptional LysR family regulator
MNLDSERLAAFQAVARSGGFSRAARLLHKTQPAISQAIRALEEDVGERLFVRTGRGSRLTAAGEVLLEHVEESFAALARGQARLEARRTLVEGELVIGTSDTNACYVLPPVLAAFRERYPGVEVRLSNRPSPVTEEQVLAHDVDLGFVTLPAASAGLSTERMVVREDVAIFAPGHALARRKRIRFEELLDSPLLLLDRGARTRAFIDERLKAHPGRAHVAMELASIEVVKRLVALGFGVSVVPRIAVEAEVEAGSLFAASVFPRSEARALGVIHASSAPLSRAGSKFVEIAREVLGAAPPA